MKLPWSTSAIPMPKSSRNAAKACVGLRLTVLRFLRYLDGSPLRGEPMEVADSLLLERFLPQNPELRSLIEAHKKFEQEIESMAARDHLVPTDRQQLRVLKKQKLRGRDRIEEILRGYRDEPIEA
jgi:uncharacterized protein YdcH (DUF465 family)